MPFLNEEQPAQALMKDLSQSLKNGHGFCNDSLIAWMCNTDKHFSFAIVKQQFGHIGIQKDGMGEWKTVQGYSLTFTKWSRKSNHTSGRVIHALMDSVFGLWTGIEHDAKAHVICQFTPGTVWSL